LSIEPKLCRDVTMTFVNITVNNVNNISNLVLLKVDYRQRQHGIPQESCAAMV